jgi:hypothetical protein
MVPPDPIFDAVKTLAFLIKSTPPCCRGRARAVTNVPGEHGVARMPGLRPANAGTLACAAMVAKPARWLWPVVQSE